MQTDNRLFDDVARLASGALGTLHGVKAEIDAMVQSQVERIAGRMDLVGREEFEVVKAMAQAARLENERLAQRVAALEARLAGEPPALSPATSPDATSDPL